MLSHISSARMDEVGFEIDVGDVGTLGWNEIDAALQHSSFSGLRKVEVRVVQWPDPFTMPDEGDVSRIMDSMPRCHARGILHIRKVVHLFLTPEVLQLISTRIGKSYVHSHRDTPLSTVYLP